MISFIIPVRTVSENKLRACGWKSRHFGSKKKGIPSAAKQKEMAWWHTSIAADWRGVSPTGSKQAIKFNTIRIVRLSPREMDDDNLRGALKASRDGIAKALWIDDGDPRIQWEYAQEKSKTYGVRVEIR